MKRVDNVNIILVDNAEYNRMCLEYFEKREDIPEEIKKRFLSKEEREQILSSMSDSELDVLIDNACSNQAKSYYRKFKRG